MTRLENPRSCFYFFFYLYAFRIAFYFVGNTIRVG